MTVVRHHCRRCLTDWTTKTGGVRCWLCGLPGAPGPIPRVGVLPAAVYVPTARQETT